MAGLGITNSGLTTVALTATGAVPVSSTLTNNQAAAQRVLSYMKDQTNTPVTSQASFNAAVTLLRTGCANYPSGGRSTSNPCGWQYPPAWNTVETNMASTDVSSAGSELIGNPSDTVAALTTIGVSLLAVNWMSCTTSAFVFQSLDPNSGTYWGERWELYKHQYILSGWSWKRGITRTEYWNEPDLSSSCINGSTWIEHVTLRSQAIQNAYADFNSDVQQGLRACPTGFTCPISPVVLSSAYSSATFGTVSAAASVPIGGPFAYQTFANQHLLFPPQTGTVDPTWSNSGAMSWHSYGKTGHALLTSTQGLSNSLTALGLTSMPVVTTEHQCAPSCVCICFNSLLSHALRLETPQVTH
jgi:hypothetical protein